MIKDSISLKYIFNFLKDIKKFDKKTNNGYIKKEMIPIEGENTKTKCIHIHEYIHKLLFGYHGFLFLQNDSLHIMILDVNMVEHLLTIVYESDLIHLESFINYIFTDFIQLIDKTIN